MLVKIILRHFLEYFRYTQLLPMVTTQIFSFLLIPIGAIMVWVTISSGTFENFLEFLLSVSGIENLNISIENVSLTGLFLQIFFGLSLVFYLIHYILVKLKVIKKAELHLLTKYLITVINSSIGFVLLIIAITLDSGNTDTSFLLVWIMIYFGIQFISLYGLLMSSLIDRLITKLT
ncbi:hypothetical protein ACFLZY_02290 [Patescibacteria group bacterium]